MSSVYVSHPLERGVPPAWATIWGDSEYGPFVGFKVAGVEYLLHWIPAGTFVMGSPVDEPGRDDDETQHLVTLSEGFWMGETPVTQALWKAVMGTDNNPSRFKDDRRPVESVSWHEATNFIETLNNHRPGLDMKLPTEAQWEYACRAGTQEATYAGPLEIQGERNAPVLDAIAWYGGNSGHHYELEEFDDSSGWKEKQYNHSRAGTRRVATRCKNPWGLNDMLGNVWEWCREYYAPYDHSHVLSMDHPVIDPIGPMDEGSDRVLRGGSWRNPARSVRAAYRNPLGPASRWPSSGFRLSRGH